ncbi:MAG: NUDIX domain-containing protein [Patescibacteria group bacterium]
MIDNQKELFIVVDKDDNVIEYRTRYDCHHDKSLFHRAIGVIIYNDENKIILQKRSMLKDLNPGKYTLSVSGHVTKGESYKEAAIREMQEEIGIQTSIKYVTKFLCKMPEETEMEMVFTARHNGPFTIAEDEVEKAEFFKKEEIIKIQEKLTPFAKMSLQNIGIL